MNRRVNSQASLLVIILGILTILAQFVTYQLFELNIVIWGISCVVSMICCHVLLEQSSTYRICFDYSFLSLFISLVIIVLTYQGNAHAFLPYSNTMLGIALINWLIPMLHCFIRYMLDYGSIVDDFISFYRYSSVLFLLFYLAILIYGGFTQDVFAWAYKTGIQTPNFIPFSSISIQIEDFLYDAYPLGDIFAYLGSRILIYIPYGFYITLILLRQERLIRFSSLLILPFIIELLQYFMIPARCDIDDLIYAFIGGLFGCMFFHLTNVIFKGFSGNDFLIRRYTYRGSATPLHF